MDDGIVGVWFARSTAMAVEVCRRIKAEEGRGAGVFMLLETQRWSELLLPRELEVSCLQK